MELMNDVLKHIYISHNDLNVTRLCFLRSGIGAPQMTQLPYQDHNDSNAGKWECGLNAGNVYGLLKIHK